jgi:hypothetical protein
MFDSIEASHDGRCHDRAWTDATRAQARPVIAAHKPLFIDKPMAGSLRDDRNLPAGPRGGVPVFARPRSVPAG